MGVKAGFDKKIEECKMEVGWSHWVGDNWR